jgi:hypothetical protein
MDGFRQNPSMDSGTGFPMDVKRIDFLLVMAYTINLFGGKLVETAHMAHKVRSVLAI